MALRIATDIHGLERVAPPDSLIRAYPASQYPSAWARRWRLLRAAFGSHHLILHFSLPDVIFFAVSLFLIPFHRCRLTTLDFFIARRREGGLGRLVQWSLNRVDRYLVYFKDSSIFERKWSIPHSKFQYVPYKVNAIEVVLKTPVSDGGYIFCGGRSRRDFATLFAAVEPLGYPVRLVTSTEPEMNPHGSSLAGLRVPSNVEISTNDPSEEFFIRSMSAARLVVIPILRDSTTQAGIAVYLQGMALGKCVIISAGLGVSDVLDQGQAWIVKAGDPAALQEAIDQAWKNPTLRDRYGQAALSYARALGGENELRRRILRALP